MRRTAVVLVVLLAAAGRAHAHQTSVKNVDVVVDGAAVDVRVLVAPGDVAEVAGAARDGRPTPAAIRAHARAVAELIEPWLAVGDGHAACPATAPRAEMATDDARFVEVRWRARCAAPVGTLVLDFHGFFAFDRQHQALVRIGRKGGEAFPTMVAAGDPVLRVTVGAPPPSTLLAFVRTGMDHIFSGRDHISFILALLLVVLLVRTPDGRWHQKHLVPSLKATAKIVTAFTVAHSLTLISASLGWVSLPSRFVESMIALSIAYTAIENMVRPDVPWRYALTFGFGLIHGLGFASVLAELLPPHDVIVPLLAFNVGVELGQLCIVAVALPTFAVICRLLGADRYRRTFMPAASTVIAVLGAIWIVERVIGVTILGL